ncbi:IS30 family transposase [Fulvimarina sp. 2208YS6-2-32]|uniref:IS30 family transposase n=1 Tax=Fulvimarina uroteuthidis TaxID=3098149 RepID=A0ABU5I0U9_9HYPH|nr:IS30 family transposase [Fulvimarina sp. 2208YS6-2-32]MDY8108836.1 IS30 family transposase [Fulvimarina sp. 2208YS6-2-32]
MPSYSHLSTWEREQIAALLAAGHSGNSIAGALGRSAATIGQELRSNRLCGGGYSRRQADGAYLKRRRRAAVLEQDARLRQFVVDRLAEGWSPEQVAGWLKKRSEPKLRSLVTETIYAFIYRAMQKAEELWRYLVMLRRTRRALRGRCSRDTIKNRRSIHDRPASADDRKEAGHWEAELVICKQTKLVLVLHERKTRVTLAINPIGETAAETVSAMRAVFRRVDPGLRPSVTFHNDTTFVKDALVTDLFGMSTWFCDAYASWQKGGIQDANGRLRRWLPSWLDIDAIDEATCRRPSSP